MQETDVKMSFSNQFDGDLQGKTGRVKIGREEGDFAPYELLLGGLGACFYATFLDIVRKMKLDYDSAEIKIHGVKRDEIPTTLRTVKMEFAIMGAAESKQFHRAAELAAKYCSIHETLAKVAEIELVLSFHARAVIE